MIAHQMRILDQFEMTQDVLLLDQMNAVELKANVRRMLGF